MTTPMVDTVRNIPLIVEKQPYEPMEADHDSGFPFDRADRSDHFRSQLDDLAQRHPEFAEHLGGFPFHSDTFGRQRQHRPFPSSRFDRFFDDDPFDEPDHPARTQQQQQQQQQQQYTPPPAQQPQEEPQIPRPERGRKQNIQQSNTVDLGQKQEPVNDRSQRSMSAPPTDNRQQQRYVSSIHIPINKDGGMEEMGKGQSQPEKPRSNERVIPIHVEGRDEPVLPKNMGYVPQQQQQQQPQAEKIFGHSPSQFTQFVPKHTYQQQQEVPVQREQKPAQEVPVQREQKIPVQKQPPPPQPQQQQEPPQVAPQQPPPKSSTPIDMIQLIQKDVSALMSQVEKFEGMPRDKQYLYLDEMLTRNLLKLDNIDTQGQENIRQARKEAVKCIEGCIGILEAKAAANAAKIEAAKPENTQPPTNDKMEVEEKKDVEEKIEAEIKEEQPKVEEVKVVAEDVKNESSNVTEPQVEEKMEVTKESEVSEPNVKPDEEMKDVAEEKKQESSEEKCEDGKEKKKGKKKAVKK